MRRKKGKKTYSDIPNKEELRKIFDYSKSRNFNLYIVIRTLLSTGRRIGELYNVKVSDIDFETRLIQTEILKKRKKKPEPRPIFIDEITCNLLKEWIHTRNLKPGDYVFRYKSYRSIQRHFDDLIFELGITKRLTLHSFRALFVTYFRKKGKPYEYIKMLTGHSKESSLTSYDRLEAFFIEDDARELIDGMMKGV